MLGDADGADARAAAAMRDAKSLMKVEVANIGADVAGAAKANLRVHVCAIHVNLAAMAVNDFANLANGRFEHAVRGRVGDHQRGQIVFVGVGFRAQIGEIDIAVFETAHRNDAEAGRSPGPISERPVVSRQRRCGRSAGFLSGQCRS